MLLPREVVDRLIGAPRLQFAGATWPLAITYGVLLVTEGEMGEDVLSGGQILAPSARFLRVLLWACLDRCESGLPLRAAGARITREALPAIHEALEAAWRASMPAPQAKKKKATPPAGDSVPLSWLESWSIARQELQLSEAEWLEMTPRQLQALRERQMERIQEQELMMGILAAQVTNFSFCAPKRPVTPESFMLHKIDPGPVTGEMIMREMAKLRAN